MSSFIVNFYDFFEGTMFMDIVSSATLHNLNFESFDNFFSHLVLIALIHIACSWAIKIKSSVSLFNVPVIKPLPGFILIYFSHNLLTIEYFSLPAFSSCFITLFQYSLFVSYTFSKFQFLICNNACFWLSLT